MGTMERHHRGVLHPQLHRVQVVVPKSAPEKATSLGNDCCNPQMVPLLFVHSTTTALVTAVAMGLMGGIATAAYLDLIIRCCPAGLQGTILMASTALSVIVSRFGDVLGTKLYQEYGGFAVCVIAITVVYALILPVLALVPNDLTVTADGQKLQAVNKARS